MPHDRKGVLLSAGDVVNVPCKVTDIQASTGFCNVTVETVEEMPGNNTKTTITLNAKQVERVSGAAGS